MAHSPRSAGERGRRERERKQRQSREGRSRGENNEVDEAYLACRQECSIAVAHCRYLLQCVCIGMCVNAVAHGRYLLFHTSQSVKSHKWLHPTSVDLLDMPDTYCITTQVFAHALSHQSLHMPSTSCIPVSFGRFGTQRFGPTIKNSGAEPNVATCSASTYSAGKPVWVQRSIRLES